MANDTDGTLKTWFLAWPHGACKVTVEHWYNAETTGTPIDLLADHVAGTATLYSLGNSIADATLHNLKLSFYAKVEGNPNPEAKNKQMTVPTTLVLGHNSVAANDMFIANYTDGIDQTP